MDAHDEKHLADGPAILEADVSATQAQLADWTPAEEKALLRKFDLRIMPFMIFTFIFNYIDRAILSNARLKGLQSDLKMNDIQYATSISILFIGYILMQVPSNLLLHSVKWPKWYFLIVVALWGTVSACSAAAHNSAQLIGLRFCLGFVEATLYPGAIYYLSRFYTAKEMGLRIGYLNIGSNLSSGIGSLIAAGVLAKMNGVHGIAGWRWLFIIEGSITVALGLLAPLLLLDYPADTTALNARDKYIAEARLVNERGVANDAPEDKSLSAALAGVKMALRDPITYCFTLTYFFAIDSLGYGVYQPSIIKTFGFSTTITLVMVFPTAVFQTIVCLIVSYFSDRHQKRWIYCMGCWSMTFIGYIIFLATKTDAIGARYFALFISSFGFNSGIVLLAWVSQTVPYPPAKRAAMIGFVNGFANLGQIPSSYYFQSKWAPTYRVSMGIEMVMLSIAMCLSTGTMFLLRRRNAALDKGEAEAIVVSESVLRTTEGIINDPDAPEKEANIRQRWRFVL